MARSDTLELLGKLIDRLQPVGSKSSGEPIRSADWNALVDSVGELARVVVAREKTTDEFLEERYARADHQHLGQATMGWFDAPTRAVLEANIQGSVEQRAAVDQTRNDLAQLTATVKTLRQELSDLKIELDGLRDSDAARERGIEKVAIRVENFRDVETRVSGLDERLGSIGRNVQEALGFRNQLVDDTGAVINVRDMRNRVTELEGLRANLTMANGKVVQIREIERSIARLEGNTITRVDINDAVGSRLRDRAALEQAGLLQAVREGVEEGLKGRFDAIDQVTVRHEDRITAINQNLAAQDTAVQQQSTRLTAAERQISGLNALPDRLASHTLQLTDLESRLQNTQSAVAGLPAVQSELTNLRGAVTGLASLRNTVGAFDTRVSALETNTAVITQLVTASETGGTRIAALEAALPELRDAARNMTLQAATIRQVTTRLTAAESQLDNFSRLSTTVDGLSTQVRTFAQFQTSTTQTLNDIVSRVGRVQVLEDRLTANERLATETRNSLSRATDQLTALSVRVDRGTVVRGPLITGPIG